MAAKTLNCRGVPDRMGEVKLKSNTVIVTGAAGSLGSALTLECLHRGWTVVMLDADRKGLEAVYDQVQESEPGEPVLYPLDLSGAGPEHFGQMLEALGQQFGGLDALVHCAAHFDGLRPHEHVAPEQWLATLQVNLNAAWLLSVHCLPLLREAEKGRLYFMLEDLSRMEGAFWGAYGVSKHALMALANQLAAECRDSGPEVLAFNPGPMRSSLRSRAYHAENPESQPSPDPVARVIADYLDGRRDAGESVFIDLADR
jgi:NAD(P)-dependent dehydrogenase (short-subunit alcohol dehydrogenase family)